MFVIEASEIMRCPACESDNTDKLLERNLYVCPVCGYHYSIGARRRIMYLFDEGSFVERKYESHREAVTDFPGYEEKLRKSLSASGEDEAVIAGTAEIHGLRTCVFAMEPRFMMGSMGLVVGERITEIFEYAQKKRLPVIGFSVSGGARMQEGAVSLMQMAKTCGAVKRHSDAGGLFISVLTNPTTGGVCASFAMSGDIIVAENGALIGFAGPRVIEQTIRQKLPEGFQRSEFQLEHGFADILTDRRELRELLSRLLSIHER